MRPSPEVYNSVKIITILGSRLEYGSIIWNLLYRIHVSSLENIKRKLVKYLALHWTEEP